MSQPTETSAEIKPAVKTTLDRNLDLMYKTVVTDAGKDAGKMPEAAFRDWFLPQFACKVPMREDLMSQWIAVAGQPAAEVAIIDEAGNELFRVPPLFSTAHIKRIRPDNVIDFSSIGTLMELHARKSPQQAQEMLKTRLIARYRASHQPGQELSENEKRWLAIFERYGYVSAQELKAQAQPGAANAATSSDDLDDDDFTSR